VWSVLAAFEGTESPEGPLCNGLLCNAACTLSSETGSHAHCRAAVVLAAAAGEPAAVLARRFEGDIVVGGGRCFSYCSSFFFRGVVQCQGHAFDQHTSVVTAQHTCESSLNLSSNKQQQQLTVVLHSHKACSHTEREPHTLCLRQTHHVAVHTSKLVTIRLLQREERSSGARGLLTPRESHTIHIHTHGSFLRQEILYTHASRT
jgi:hypothetical protein